MATYCQMAPTGPPVAGLVERSLGGDLAMVEQRRKVHARLGHDLLAPAVRQCTWRDETRPFTSLTVEQVRGVRMSVVHVGEGEMLT